MEREELLARINAIGTCEDEGERRTQLDSFRDDINTLFDENERLQTENENITNANENLRSANMDLFLQLGEQKSKKEITKSETGADPDPEPQKRKFEDLFNEKGELK